MVGTLLRASPIALPRSSLPPPPSTNPNSHSVVQLRRHVSYPGTPSSFDASHPELVASLPPETLAVVHAELAAELRRRRREPAESARRRRKIAAAYKRLRPDAYRLDVDERLAALARIAREAVRADPATAREKLLERAAAISGADGGGGPTIRQRPAGVFSFPAFPARFRDALREEIAHFEASLPAIGVPVARPNTMNENGVLLAEIPGMCEGVVDPLVREYVAPLSAALYGDEYYGGGGGGKKTSLKTAVSSSSDGAADLDHHRAFTVAYGPGDRDVDLARHWDDAEVTINVNLGGAFEGGELVFGEVVSNETKRRLASASASGGGGGGGGGEEEEDERPVVVPSGGSPPTAVRHRAGVAVLHRGAHSHEAAPTESGTRVNLVVWCRSSRRRREACAMCGRDKSDGALGKKSRAERSCASIPE